MKSVLWNLFFCSDDIILKLTLNVKSLKLRTRFRGYGVRFDIFKKRLQQIFGLKIHLFKLLKRCSTPKTFLPTTNYICKPIKLFWFQKILVGQGQMENKSCDDTFQYLDIQLIHTRAVSSFTLDVRALQDWVTKIDWETYFFTFFAYLFSMCLL